MAWVNAENARSAKALDVGPVYDKLAETALKVLESPTRLPNPGFRVGEVYNTWQDAQHVRGILRRTSLDSYLTDQPDWHTVIDYDALAVQDNQKWVAHGLNCLYPGDGLCLVTLSAGGEDADTLREFDLKTGKFVEGGFVLPHSKQNVAWIDKDTLLVARNWGARHHDPVRLSLRRQTLEARHPTRRRERGLSRHTIRRQRRPGALHDSQGHTAILLERGVDFFNRAVALYTPEGPKKISIPGKSEIHGMLDGQIIVELNEDWKPEGLSTTFPRAPSSLLTSKPSEKIPPISSPPSSSRPPPRSSLRKQPSPKTT